MSEPNTIAQTPEGIQAACGRPRQFEFRSRTGRTSAISQLETLAQSLQFGTGPLKFLAILVCIEYAWAVIAGLRLEQFAVASILIVVPLAITLVLQAARRLNVIANITYFLAIWFGALVIGKVVSYLAATFGFPLFDAVFDNLDRAAGLKWRDWYAFVHRHPALLLILTVAYRSLTPQIWFAIAYFSFNNRRSEGEELWWNCLVALLIISLISGLLPALGTFQYHTTALPFAIHLPDLLALRAGTMHELRITLLRGIITFPSFHAASAVLLAHAYRRHKPMYRLAIVLNVLMLISTPSEGGHYFVDVLAGCMVAVVSIHLVKWLKNWRLNLTT